MAFQKSINLCSEFNRPENSDLIVQIQGETLSRFYLHKVVLSAGSPFFKAQLNIQMFGGLQRDAQGRLILSFRADQLLPSADSDVAVSLLEKLLSYLYGCVINLSPQEIPLIYRLADFLTVESLKNEIINYIRGDLSASDLGEIANVVWQLEDMEIFDTIYSRLLRNPLTILEAESADLVIALISNDEFQMNDLDLIHLLEQWREKVGDEEVNKVLPYVRLASMMFLATDRVSSLRTTLDHLPAYQAVREEALSWNRRWDTPLPNRRDILRSISVNSLIKNVPSKVYTVMSGGVCGQPLKLRNLSINRVSVTQIGYTLCDSFPEGRIGPGSLIYLSEYIPDVDTSIHEIVVLAVRTPSYYWQ